jgi:hypothetical protein
VEVFQYLQFQTHKGLKIKLSGQVFYIMRHILSLFICCRAVLP